MESITLSAVSTVPGTKAFSGEVPGDVSSALCTVSFQVGHLPAQLCGVWGSVHRVPVQSSPPRTGPEFQWPRWQGHVVAVWGAKAPHMQTPETVVSGWYSGLAVVVVVVPGVPAFVCPWFFYWRVIPVSLWKIWESTGKKKNCANKSQNTSYSGGIQTGNASFFLQSLPLNFFYKTPSFLGFWLGQTYGFLVTFI